jgi:hypothetical protein
MLGDIIFALGATVAGATLGAEYIGDHLLAVALGLVFQYFAIAPMRGLSFRKGIVAAAKADILSLTAFEVRLFGWMALMAFVFFPDPHLTPNSPVYSFLMQIGMVLGVLHRLPGQRSAYPSRHQGGHVAVYVEKPSCSWSHLLVEQHANYECQRAAVSRRRGGDRGKFGIRRRNGAGERRRRWIAAGGVGRGGRCPALKASGGTRRTTGHRRPVRAPGGRQGRATCGPGETRPPRRARN